MRPLMLALRLLILASSTRSTGGSRAHIIQRQRGCAVASTRRPSFTFASQALTLTASYLTRQVERELPLNIHLTTGPIVSLIAGILILVIPRLLNYIVAIYLILIGVLGLGMLGGI
jgi:hypothetical protein